MAFLHRRFAGCPALAQCGVAAHAGCLLLLALAAASAKPSTPEGGTVKAQHGDWQVVCKPPPPGAKNEVCALVQSVTAEDRNNVGLTVYFQKFSDGKRVLRVFAPLGVLLPPGLGLKIDDKDVGHAPFLRCHTFACYAQVVVEDQLIEQLKNGQDGGLHHLPDRGSRHRHPDLARRLRPGARRAQLILFRQHPPNASAPERE